MTLFRNKYRIESTRLKGWDYASAGWILSPSARETANGSSEMMWDLDRNNPANLWM
jgi:hypothetical protein